MLSMVRLTEEIKSGLLDDNNEFISEYHKHIYLALFYAELSDNKLQRALALRDRINDMTREYEQLLVEADEYTDRFNAEFELAKQLGE